LEKEIVLYTNGCSRCSVVKAHLIGAGGDFIMVTDMDEIMKVAGEIGVSEMPILKVDGEFYSGFGAVEKAKKI